jgi:hypothetical protein
MSATIKLHLAAEDRYVYPTLANSADPGSRPIWGPRFLQADGRHRRRLRGIRREVEQCASVAADPEGFRDHANAIFKALHGRIQRENKELYAVAAKA